MSKPELHVVKFSGGKDSTAMLLRMLEEKKPVDIIIFNDTGMEFPELYDHIEKVKTNIKREITVISSKKTFEWLMFEKPVKRRNGSNIKGLSWPSSQVRWCTAYLKRDITNAYLKELRKDYEVYEYIGLAADEQYRLERKGNQKPNMRYPLIEWGMTEADCLKYCKDRGYDWGGLYEVMHRVSCWCCPLQRISELRTLYTKFPRLWAKLKEYENATWRTMRADYSLDELEVRFNLAEKYEQKGLSIRSRAFLKECKDTCKQLQVKTVRH